MATFPTLSSGAITQHPLIAGVSQNTSVIRFMDGADQRFLLQGRQLRRWQIKLELLNDVEMDQLEAFFGLQQGPSSPFSFNDPVTGLAVPNCRIGVSELTTVYQGLDAGTASLWVMETNG